MSFCVKIILTLLFIPKTLRQFYITFLNWHHTLPQYLNHFFRKHKQDCTILVRKDRFPIYTCSSWLYFSVQSFSFVFVFVRVRLQFKAVSRSMKGDSNQCMHDWVDPTEQKKAKTAFTFLSLFTFFLFFFLFLSFSRWHGQTLTQVGCGFRSADISLYCSFHPSYQRTFQVYLLTFFRFYVCTSAFPPFKVTAFFCLSFTSVLSYRSIAVLLIDVESVRKRKEKNRERQKL